MNFFVCLLFFWFECYIKIKFRIMKKILMFLLVCSFIPAWNASATIGIGEKALLADVKMLDVSGEKISMADAAGENGLMVIFSCNTCPFVKEWEKRYNELKNFAQSHKVGMIVINSNYGSRNSGDSYEDMKSQAAKHSYDFPYVVDEESRIANAFGGQTTPHVFLFDKNMTLAYKGVIDDNYKNPDEVKQPYAKNAIASIAAGEKVAVAETKPLGCSIKRKAD